MARWLGHYFNNNSYIPLVFCLLQDKQTDTYMKILKSIILYRSDHGNIIYKANKSSNNLYVSGIGIGTLVPTYLAVIGIVCSMWLKYYKNL